MIPQLQTLQTWLASFGDVFTVVLCYFVWKIMTNHLPHMEESLKRLEIAQADASAKIDTHIKDEMNVWNVIKDKLKIAR